MGDPYDIWEDGIAKFPSYKKDFDKAMGFTVDDGFPENDFEDQPKFSEEFKQNEIERGRRISSGESDADQDELFFTRIKNQPRVGNIFNDNNDAGIFSNNSFGRQGGIFSGNQRKKKSEKSLRGLFGF